MRLFRLPTLAIIAPALSASLLVPPALSAQTSSQDYTQWRGEGRDGSASAFTAPASWPDRLTQKWKVEVGEGYGTPIVVGNRVYALTRQGGDEVMAARDVANGAVVWETRYPAPHTIMTGARGHGQGPKSTPLFFNGRLYTLGVTGIVSCFAAADGALLWQKPAPPNPTLYANSATSPIVDDGAIVLHVGGHDKGALTKFDAVTGAVKWAWDGDGPAYASPIIVTLDGVRQIVTVTQRNIVGVNAATGALLWQRPWANQFSNHAVSPLLFRDTIIVTGYEMGVVAFRPRQTGGAWTTETVWQTQEVSMFMSNPVLIDDVLFGLSQRNSGQLFTLDARTGSVIWRGPGREATNTSMVRAGDLLFLLNDDGKLNVAPARRAGLEKFRTYTVSEQATWAQPAISGSRIFVKDLTTLALWTVE